MRDCPSDLRLSLVDITTFNDSRLTTFENIVNKVRDRVQGVLDSESRKAIVRASIKFCIESDICFYERAFEQVYKGQILTFAKESAVNHNQDKPQVSSARIIKITTNGEMLRKGIDYSILSNDFIKFNRNFRNVVVYGTYKPIDEATLLPSVLVEDYSDAIADGASYYLTMQPNRPWTNIEMSAYFRQLFVEGYREAKQFRLESSQDIYNAYHPKQCFW